MAGPRTTAPAPGHPPPGGRRAAGERRPWWIWAAPFAVVLVVFVIRNRFLFTARCYEQGDAGRTRS
jgi:hypothetical protein